MQTIHVIQKVHEIYYVVNKNILAPFVQLATELNIKFFKNRTIVHIFLVIIFNILSYVAKLIMLAILVLSCCDRGNSNTNNRDQNVHKEVHQSSIFGGLPETKWQKNT